MLLGEWQGILQTDDDDQKFCSVIELLRLIKSKVGPFRADWENK
jgi:hypothetical protein